MTILNISLPESIQDFVAQQVDKGGYGTVNEYILDLLCQEKAKAERVESLLLEGLDSGEPLEVTDEWWEQKTQFFNSTVLVLAMTKKILITPKASQDIDNHFAYIHQNNVDAALRFFDAVRETLAKLAKISAAGRLYPVNNQHLEGLRRWQVKGFENYLIFYLTSEGNIKIVRILHAARDIEEILKDE
jgi:Plasmid stabilization system protein